VLDTPLTGSERVRPSCRARHRFCWSTDPRSLRLSPVDEKHVTSGASTGIPLTGWSDSIAPMRSPYPPVAMTCMKGPPGCSTGAFRQYRRSHARPLPCTTFKLSPKRISREPNTTSIDSYPNTSALQIQRFPSPTLTYQAAIAIRAQYPPTAHAHATSCPMSTCRQVRS